MAAVRPPPDELYGELFDAVQLSGIFEDSKTFPDAIPRQEPALILRAFSAERGGDDFDLERFVRQHFDLPSCGSGRARSGGDGPLRRHIEQLWDRLLRAADHADDHSSLIPLPQPYIVPGGRFREIYYWDSYFTMLGLAASGRTALIRSMVDNFAYLIGRIGFIPNGNRSYYCTRSQPPMFAVMVKLLAAAEGRREVLLDYMDALEAEYASWMSGAEALGNGVSAVRRVVDAGGVALNRYWDDVDRPRAESYAEDVQLARDSGPGRPQLLRDIRAACESGWDFSSRWLGDERNEASIRTTRVVPVDLNAILFGLESTLAETCELAGRESCERFYRERAESRGRLIRELFFDEATGLFVDLLLPDLEPTGCRSLAAAFPLFFGVATPEQAEQCRRTFESEFLRAGGWTTTLTRSGQQWDAPNGWAPLHWVVYAGLKNYGFTDAAEEGARRWVRNNMEVYEKTGRLLEKYNVEQIGEFTGGGEYEVQHGFGWTNGVLLRLMDDLHID